MKSAGALRPAAFLLLAAPALLRALVAMAPNPYFVIDPRVLAVPLEGLGPAGSVAVDACSLLGCFLALLAEHRERRAVDARLLLLFLAPVGVLAWHGWNDAEQMRVASQWTAAMATAVGATHLARDPRWRIVLLGAVVALTIPLAVKGIYQVTIEYGDTIASFEQNRQALLDSQGWETGSSAAEIYVRRLTQREATGWFALSNVYGSVMAMLATFWVGAALATARSKLQSGWLGVVILFAAAGLTGLAVSFSKGAGAAAVVGLILAAMCLLPRKWKQHLRPLTGRVTLGLIGTALAVTAVRGLLFPESLQSVDGYSLLFRWHYWVGAAGMLGEHPLAGVGAGGFQNAYLLHRPPLSPEEVTSPHSVFIDWLAAGGGAMIAWVALTLMLLTRAAPSASAPSVRDANPTGAAGEHPTLDRRLLIGCSLGLTVLSGGVAWYLNRRVLFIDYQVVLMPLSLAGLAGSLALVEFLIRHVSLRLLRWAVWAALTVALLHAQIEMTMTQPGSASLVMLLLGAVSARAERRQSDSPGDQRSALPALVLMGMFVAAHLILVARPVWGTQTHLRRAHEQLSTVGAVRTALTQAGNASTLDERMEHLQRAELLLRQAEASIDLTGTWREIQSAVQLNDAARVQRLIATGGTLLDEAISRLEVDRIAAALRELELARHMRPIDAVAWREASKLWMHLALLHDQAGNTASRDEAADIACRLAEEHAVDRPASANAAATAARRWYERNRLAATVDAMQHALLWQRRVVELDPNGLEARRTLARMLDEAGLQPEAIEAYERTLEINEHMRLDPLKQLSDRELQAVRKRIAELRGEGG